MNAEQAILKKIEVAVCDCDEALLEESMEGALQEGLPSYPVMRALTMGLDAARTRLRSHTTSIPEFLLAVDVMNYGFAKLLAFESGDEITSAPKTVVIGVVEGDVHDLGKNIVSGVLKACGFDVVDLGRDVQIGLFAEEALRREASMLALSCMMSTALPSMRSIVAEAKIMMPQMPVIVGGAVLDESVALAMGADGYAESAVMVPEEVSRVLSLQIGV
jgi:methanogenic corrinoid protein MtbC1